MGVIKVLIIIVVVLLLYAALATKHLKVEREVVINKPKQEVFDYVKLFSNQTSYNVRVMKDPNKKMTFSGTDGTVGFINTRDGNKEAGKGEQEIKSIKDGERIDVEIRFERPMKMTNQTYTTTESTGDNQTKVTMVFYGDTKFPFQHHDSVYANDAWERFG
jgi:hypothetical protein